MGKHKVLLRQLRRYQLNESECPQTLKQWQQFLERVNLAYVELDQDRYLSERSQEISSREMQALNTELQEAQNIAHLGNWILDWENKKVQLSQEAYRIFDLDLNSPPPDYHSLMQLVRQEDQVSLEKLILDAINYGRSYEAEFKIQTSSNIRWAYVMGKPVTNSNSHKIQKITGTILDITERKKAEQRELELTKKSIDMARQTGMAEVAISVLHNVGNVLNSVNVSALLLEEKIQQTKMKKLSQIAKICQDNKENISDFLMQQSKGQHLFDYLIKLSTYWGQEQKELLEELESLKKNIEHIKEIVINQQSISKVTSSIELNSPVNILEEALQIYNDTFEQADVKITREYRTNIKVMLNKNKLQQILINFIHNAKDALLTNEKNNHTKELTLRVFEEEAFVVLQVTDNGIGINAENFNKIFSFGFTTKKTGHGFGLHSSMLIAKAMDCELIMQSNGVNTGATFTLKIPKIISIS